METWATIMSQTLQASGKIPVFARSDNPVNFVSATDVAALTALAITEPGLRGQVLELGGPDNLTFNRLAAIVQDHGTPGHRSAHPAPGSAGDRVDGRRHQTRAGPPGPRRAGHGHPRPDLRPHPDPAGIPGPARDRHTGALKDLLEGT